MNFRKALHSESGDNIIWWRSYKQKEIPRNKRCFKVEINSVSVLKPVTYKKLDEIH